MKLWSKIMSLALSALFISSTMMVGAPSNIPGGPATMSAEDRTAALKAEQAANAPAAAAAAAVGQERKTLSALEALAHIAVIQDQVEKLRADFAAPGQGSNKTRLEKIKMGLAAFNAVPQSEPEKKKTELIKLEIVALEPLALITDLIMRSSLVIDSAVHSLTKAFKADPKISNSVEELSKLTVTLNSIVDALHEAVKQTYDSVAAANAAKKGQAAPAPQAEKKTVEMDLSALD